MTTCPVCGEDLRTSAVRCTGCSVIVGASSTSRFAPTVERPARTGEAPARGGPRVGLAVVGTLGFATGTFLVAGTSALLGAVTMVASVAIVVLAVRPPGAPKPSHE